MKKCKKNAKKSLKNAKKYKKNAQKKNAKKMYVPSIKSAFIFIALAGCALNFHNCKGFNNLLLISCKMQKKNAKKKCQTKKYKKM